MNRIGVCSFYDLEVTGVQPVGASGNTSERLASRFDVFFTGSGLMAQLRVMEVVRTDCPHLHPGQRGDLFSVKPSLLLEGIAEHEAREIKAQLEAAGAEVELRPCSVE